MVASETVPIRGGIRGGGGLQNRGDKGGVGEVIARGVCLAWPGPRPRPCGKNAKYFKYFAFA